MESDTELLLVENLVQMTTSDFITHIQPLLDQDVDLSFIEQQLKLEDENGDSEFKSVLISSLLQTGKIKNKSTIQLQSSSSKPENTLNDDDHDQSTSANFTISRPQSRDELNDYQLTKNNSIQGSGSTCPNEINENNNNDNYPRIAYKNCDENGVTITNNPGTLIVRNASTNFNLKHCLNAKILLERMNTSTTTTTSFSPKNIKLEPAAGEMEEMGPMKMKLDGADDASTNRADIKPEPQDMEERGYDLGQLLEVRFEVENEIDNNNIKQEEEPEEIHYVKMDEVQLESGLIMPEEEFVDESDHCDYILPSIIVDQDQVDPLLVEEDPEPMGVHKNFQKPQIFYNSTSSSSHPSSSSSSSNNKRIRVSNNNNFGKIDNYSESSSSTGVQSQVVVTALDLSGDQRALTRVRITAGNGGGVQQSQKGFVRKFVPQITQQSSSASQRPKFDINERLANWRKFTGASSLSTRRSPPPKSYNALRMNTKSGNPGAPPLLCKVCNKYYKSKNSLYNHRSMYHREMTSSEYRKEVKAMLSDSSTSKELYEKHLQQFKI